MIVTAPLSDNAPLAVNLTPADERAIAALLAPTRCYWPPTTISTAASTLR